MTETPDEYDAPAFDLPPLVTPGGLARAITTAEGNAVRLIGDAEARLQIFATGEAEKVRVALEQQLAEHEHEGTVEEPPAPDPVPAASSKVPVSKFGGDVRKAVAEIEASGSSRSVLDLDMRVLPVLGECVISKSMAIHGYGTGATEFDHSGSYRGPVFTIYQAKRNSQLESTVNGAPITTYNRETDKGQVSFRGFTISSARRETGTPREGLHFMSLDDARMSKVDFRNLTGTALKLGADEDDETKTSPGSGRVRESNFNEIGIYTSGSGAPDGVNDIPALIIQGSSADGDGTNQLFFSQLRFVYNFGRFLINGRDDGDTLRRIDFDQTQLHMLADNAAWTPRKFFPFDAVTLQGAVREINFRGVFINGGKAGTAGFVMKGDPVTAQTPKRLVLRDVNVVNTDGDLARVEKGDSIYVEGTQLASVGGRIINNRPGSDLQRYGIHEIGLLSPAGEQVAGVGGGVAWMHQPV